MSIDSTNAVTFLLSYLRIIREILSQWVLPFFDISYWDFCCSMAAAGIVVTACIACVRVGRVVPHDRENSKKDVSDRGEDRQIYFYHY